MCQNCSHREWLHVQPFKQGWLYGKCNALACKCILFIPLPAYKDSPVTLTITNLDKHTEDVLKQYYKSNEV